MVHLYSMLLFSFLPLETDRFLNKKLRLRFKTKFSSYRWHTGVIHGMCCLSIVVIAGDFLPSAPSPLCAMTFPSLFNIGNIFNAVWSLNLFIVGFTYIKDKKKKKQK